MLVVAHRALSEGVVENSLAAIRRSAEAGADLVELDVRRSLDGVPYLLHDRSLRRTSPGLVPLRAAPSRFVDRMPLRDSDERVPRLADALDALPPGVGPALHLKDRGSLRAALRVIQDQQLGTVTWLWLHGTESVRLARQIVPDARVTLLEAGATTIDAWKRHLDGAVAAGASGASIPWSDLSPELLGETTSRGLVAFSLNRDLAQIPSMVAAGLGGVITDEPSVTRQALNELGAAAPAVEN